MTNNDPWRPFEDVMADPWKWIKDWRIDNQGRVIGHLLPDAPEELIHACSATPFAVEGAGKQVSHAQAHIPGYTCSHAMGALEMGVRGDMDFLDAMVIPYVCDTTRNLFHIWRKVVTGFPAEFLRLPKRLDFKGARDYLVAEFTRLFESLQSITGVERGEEGLKSSIILYNQSRALLRKAFANHGTRGDVWTNERLRNILASSLVVPRELHMEWMKDLPWDETGQDTPMTPVYLHGKVFDPPQLAGILDQLGMVTIGDDLVTGQRNIFQDVDEQIPAMEALALKHLNAWPYTGYHPNPVQYVADFLNRVKESRAKGVVFLNPKFCEAAAFDTPDFQDALEKESIPSLVLETSMSGAPLGQLKLRLEAFQEMIDSDLDY